MAFKLTHKKEQSFIDASIESYTRLVQPSFDDIGSWTHMASPLPL